MLVVLAVALVVSVAVVTRDGGPEPHPPEAPAPERLVATPAPARPVATPAPEPSVPEPPATVEPTRPPRSAVPLRVLVAGDSMWEVAGPKLADRLQATGHVTPTVDVRYSSGLTRPDFFDWSAHAAELLRSGDPDLVVVLLGANDAQPLVDDGVRYETGTSGFARVYGERARQFMDQLTAGGRKVLWVGLPTMCPTAYDGRMEELSRVQREAAATVPDVTFVPTRALFADADGGCLATSTDATGQSRRLRGGDGIHLSGHGADRLVDHLLPLIEQR